MLYLYNFPSLNVRDPNLLQYDDGPVHNASFVKTRCVKVGLEELECSAQILDLNPTDIHTFGMTWNTYCAPHLLTCAD